MEKKSAKVRNHKRCHCGISIPCFNLPGYEKAKYCSKCKPLEAVDVVHKLCQCGLARANYNLPGNTKAIYCVSCKPDHAVDVSRRRCQCGLAKPRYNLRGNAKAIYCISCKPEQAVDVLTTRCQCGLAIPCFNVPGSKIGKFCVKCKPENAENVKNKKCECGIARAYYNLKGNNEARYCFNCKPEGSVNVKEKRCECDSAQATFGWIGFGVKCCAKCKKANMVFRPNKKCNIQGCTELAIFGIQKRERCECHKLETDTNMVEEVCASCGLMNILNQDKMCSFCNPAHFKTMIVRKEKIIQDVLDVNEILYTHHDQIVNGTECGKERPDFVFECDEHIVILEVDEHQHSSYPCECEQVRMINITQSFGGKPVLWIRYNPDSFKCEGRKMSVHANKRHDVLIAWLKWALAKKITNLGEVLYLFYNNCKELTYESEVFVLPQL